jgi:hypothetical protein
MTITTSTTSTSVELKNIYLMWVGSESYPTIESYAKEADALGISKRLPNANIARALGQPDTVVFVAHDEGEHEPCPKCAGPVENPEWRMAETKALKAERDRDAKAERAADAITKADRTGEEADRKEADRLTRLLSKAQARLDARRDERNSTPRVIEVGESTGGYVMVDGERWDFRRYNYWLHQPAKFDPASHSIEEHQCKHCGGKGRLPLGKVFGMFIPSAVEYILKPEDDEKIKEEMEAKGFKTVPAAAIVAEAKRGCGKRKVGGYYAVTEGATTSTERAEAAVEKLVEAGLIEPEGATVNGDFIQFLKPVDIGGTKRFRGIKTWSLDVEVEEEAEMILEALA